VSRYQKAKTNLDLTEARDSEWQWHQPCHMQKICTSLQTNNHDSIPPLCFLQAGCPSCRPTNSVKALKAEERQGHSAKTAKGTWACLLCQQLYLLLFGIPSPTHSFIPGLKPSFSANPSHCRPSFLLLKYSLYGFPGLFTVISEHICFLLLVFLFLHFSVVGSVR